MGSCSCIISDNLPQKTVDVASLQKQSCIMDINSKISFDNINEKIDEIAPNEKIENINKDIDTFKPKLQHKNTESSNRSDRKSPTIIIKREEPIEENISNINKISMLLKETIPSFQRPDTLDSRIYCSQKTISRFLNRNYINIVILGGKAVGKSAFVIKFIQNVFEKLYIPTIGSEIKKKKFSYNTHLYDLNFTVTSGNDYKSDYSKYYDCVDFFLVFYDITSMESYEQAKVILKSEVKTYLYSYGQSMTNVVLVGNKIDDKPQRVPDDLAKKFCEKNNFQLFNISVKTNKNISTMMKTLIKTVDDIAYPN